MSLCSLAKAKVNGLIPSFQEAAAAMRDKGTNFSQELIKRMVHRLGETSEALQ
ncbi:hypothetical protein Thiosp_01321 [Thiorhodovibrio litoralis]|nr:hypothetical protein Thiosp_01321 [Thiorhodovibrio litoralis]